MISLYNTVQYYSLLKGNQGYDSEEVGAATRLGYPCKCKNIILFIYIIYNITKKYKCKAKKIKKTLINLPRSSDYYNLIISSYSVKQHRFELYHYERKLLS